MVLARKMFIGGNWKSNLTVSGVDSHLSSVVNTLSINPDRLQVMVAPTLLHLSQVKSQLRPDIILCAQTCSPENVGAYTGEVAASQLKDFGVNWVLIGHSERRTLFGETDAVVAKKVTLALANGLDIVLCIGENLQERENGLTLDVVTKHLSAVKDVVTDWGRIVVAYEPVWAIGTGRNATPEQAQEVHAFIRHWLRENVGEEAAAGTRVIYGGSVTDVNAASLIAQEDIDGFLVGGASLKPAFKVIVDVSQAN
jgi:triosephosphate isomerase (TIM)